MKKYKIHLLPLIMGGITVLAMASCSSEDEVPPRNDQAVTVKNYKMPDPTPLTNDDKATVDAIKDEYKKAVGEE